MKNFKKSLATLGLASTLLFNAVGCSSSQNNNASNSSNISAGESVNVYNIADYYLVYLDGNYYLTIRKDDSYYYSISSVGYNYTFYNVKNEELVGMVIEPRMGKTISDGVLECVYSVDQLYDYDFFAGSYGYGKIIPSAAVIPVSAIISADAFTDLEYEFLSSNSDELHKRIKNLNMLSSVNVIDHFDWYSIFSGKESSGAYRSTNGGGAYIKYRSANFKIYVCETKESDCEILLGYRCSFNNNDIGYEYVYDILNGSINYIGKNRENAYVSVKEVDYENSDNLTLDEVYNKALQEGMNFPLINSDLDSSSDVSESLSEETSTIVSDVDLTGKELEVRTDIDFGDKIIASELCVFDTSKIETISDINFVSLTDNCENYYFLNVSGKETPYGDLEYLDIFNVGNAYISKSLSYIDYAGFDKDGLAVIATVLLNNDSTDKLPIMGINDYLIMIGREDLVKDEYTLEEISEIRSTILGLNNAKKLEMSN